MDKVSNSTKRPRWIRAKYASHCACGRKIAIGQWIAYHPSNAPGKRVECESCGRKYKTTFLPDAVRAICKTI